RLRLPPALRLPLFALLCRAAGAAARRGRPAQGVLLRGAPRLRGGGMNAPVRRPELLRVEKLGKSFYLSAGLFGPRLELKAVADVSFSVREGETLGIVGESGCGKSTLGRCILQLIAPDEGRVLWLGRDLTRLANEDMRRCRRELQVIF